MNKTIKQFEALDLLKEASSEQYYKDSINTIEAFLIGEVSNELERLAKVKEWECTQRLCNFLQRRASVLEVLIEPTLKMMANKVFADSPYTSSLMESEAMIKALNDNYAEVEEVLKAVILNRMSILCGVPSIMDLKNLRRFLRDFVITMLNPSICWVVKHEIQTKKGSGEWDLSLGEEKDIYEMFCLPSGAGYVED